MNKAEQIETHRRIIQAHRDAITDAGRKYQRALEEDLRRITARVAANDVDGLASDARWSGPFKNFADEVNWQMAQIRIFSHALSVLQRLPNAAEDLESQCEEAQRKGRD